MKSTVIIGAGQAAIAAALKLRKNEYKGNILILGDEKYKPYQRPPLSKKFLKGDISEKELYFRSDEFYAERNIAIEVDVRVESIDRVNKQVITKDGRHFDYDNLILATGSRARPLPANVSKNFSNIFYLRSLDDTKKLSAHLTSKSKILVVGGGYIGLEMAAVARELGMQVTVVEMSDRILQRVASADTSDYFRSLHNSKGVDIIEGVGLLSLEGKSNVATLAALSNGDTVDVDLVVVGIGIIPNDELAKEAGLDVSNGIIVNEYCLTGDQNIFAIGDCAVYPYKGELIRIESVPNAIVQGEIVADFICENSDIGYKAIPWFWSDQYDTKLQIAGINKGYDTTIKRQEQQNDALSIWYFKGNKIISVDAINDPKSFMAGKKLLDIGATPNEDLIKDANVLIADILKTSLNS